MTDILKVNGGSYAAIENRGPGVDNISRTELFGVTSQNCTCAKCTTETEPAVADTNDSIIVPGFPKPNGLPQPNPFNGPERDLVNLPRMVRFEESPKTRNLFVPEVFYEKTEVTEPFRVAPLCANAVCTTETKPAVADTNESIIVPGFPKPNGRTQPNPFNGPERDLANFPRMVRLEDPPKTRYLFVPESWFEVFYKKTGVTGPYVFAGGIINYLLSKEIWVVDHEFPYVLATIALFYVGWKKFGASVAHHLDKEIKEYKDSCNETRLHEIKSLKETLKFLKNEVRRTEATKHVIQAKRQNIDIQLETFHRERYIQAYIQVKKRLDYHVDLTKLTRKVQHDFIVKRIVENVLSTIDEKEIFKKCLDDLQTLSAK